MAEWLNALVLKTSKGESLSRVQIPLSPPLTNNMQNDLFNIEYDFDRSKLLEGWQIYKDTVETYTDPRFEHWRKDKEMFDAMKKKWDIEDYDDDGFQVASFEEFDYGKEICELFEITNAKFKYYQMSPGFVLPFHTDYGMDCSINIMIGDNPAPVMFEESGQTYHYTQALLNVSKKHGVRNGDSERLLFRLSIDGQSFEEIRANIIRKTLDI